jgi:hypothetical protein
MSGNPCSRPGPTPEKLTLHSDPESRQDPQHSEYLHRLATLIAGGGAPIPEDLKPEDRRSVLVEVARQRRVRLICYIARSIAEDIFFSREQ